MKSIILSIQPKYVEKILSGEKTIEIRKTAPKETPFKVYVYCTYGTLLYSDYPNGNDSREIKLGSFKVSSKNNIGHQMNGKIVASFICDRVTNIHCFEDTNHTNIYSPAACLTDAKICEYLNYKNGYALHISDLKIFDKPKELGEFVKPYPIKCGTSFASIDCTGCPAKFKCTKRFITRPPQSWQYCEELI